MFKSYFFCGLKALEFGISVFISTFFIFFPNLFKNLLLGGFYSFYGFWILSRISIEVKFLIKKLPLYKLRKLLKSLFYIKEFFCSFYIFSLVFIDFSEFECMEVFKLSSWLVIPVLNFSIIFLEIFWSYIVVIEIL